MKMVTVFLLGLAVLFLSIFMSGLTLSILWSWFISGVFEIKQISIGESLGIALVLTFILGDSSRPRNEDFTELVLNVFGKCLGALLFGFIFKQFM